MTELTLVIPDLHGRQFWKQAVALYPDADTIFLGDYLDPYPSENISTDEALNNFEEIIDHAKSHSNCHLLLGNHDLHYVCDFGENCRMDHRNASLIRYILLNNLNLFNIALLREKEGKTILFSHAPVLTNWIAGVGETTDPSTLVDNINSQIANLTDHPWIVAKYLGQMSYTRGGYHDFGSPVWADVRDINDHNMLPTVDYSVFGHTQMSHQPIITDRWACLDVRTPFTLTSPSAISPIQKTTH